VEKLRKRKTPIKTKSHGRKAKSNFRYGFDELRGIFLRLEQKLKSSTIYLKFLIVNNKIGCY